VRKLLLLLLFIPLVSFGQEISLFDSEGDAVAYIDTNDEDNTIYLWNGTPVAYLSAQSNYYNIYGFNGNHLGWYEDGIVRDEDGDAVGFKKGSVSGIYTNYESYKSYKEYKPYKSYKSYAPYKPYFSNSFSNESFVLFLKRGI
jgi:hypothetical protein